jgi:hypothetical protein
MGLPTRRAALRMLAGLGGLLVALSCAFRRDPPGRSGGMMRGCGMMGSATAAEMSAYRDLFSRHTQLRRTVQEIPGGVRTTTESDDSALVAQLQTHVRAMYQHLDQGREITCMSSTLPTLFRASTGYRRQLTLTARGVSVVETSSDARLVQTIRDHAQEISGFVKDGMPAMMRGMMGRC